MELRLRISLHFGLFSGPDHNKTPRPVRILTGLSRLELPFGPLVGPVLASRSDRVVLQPRPVLVVSKVCPGNTR